MAPGIIVISGQHNAPNEVFAGNSTGILAHRGSCDHTVEAEINLKCPYSRVITVPEAREYVVTFYLFTHESFMTMALSLQVLSII